MPHLALNGAELYVETFGAPQAGRAPIVLLHGSTSTGHNDWAGVIPRLAERHFVIVPDCRGHGRSTNPRRSYSFGELAADTAALITTLGAAHGFHRAHLIGHSNGGNVALVTLLEHPEVIASCVPQAANAYVSADLVEKEPPLFDPERVAREAPDWRDEMIRLHAPTHGPEYWRDLLRLTVHAIITEPNYTPADLARVQRPTLVIQGELDAVNAPGRHAQFIAEHVPGAELWIPAGVRHNVHLEIPEAWVARVLGFIERLDPPAS